MFIDETTISVSSGRGGDGAVSFRRERSKPRGGPDGGDGGRGGDVILRATSSRNTLRDIPSGRQYRARPGQAGGGNNRTGRDGESVVLDVPVGTIVRDADRGHVLRDLDTSGLEVAVVSGGKGGKGNTRYAGPTNQTPRRAQPGADGETRKLRLELRLVADVGLVGMPNAGKSTFLSRVSAARPKIADYPFTTLEPMLGVVERDDGDLVVADIPGLIENAHQGAGLGDRFLRHIARTRVLLHLVDAELGDGAADAWHTITAELSQAGLGLETKPMLLAVSRADRVADPAGVAAALERASGADVPILSSLTGQGVEEVLDRLRSLVSGKDAPSPSSND